MLGRCREVGVELRQAEGLATLLMVAGTETAASAMARTVALLHDTGAQHRLRAEPDLLPEAVREGLRVTTPAPVIPTPFRRFHAFDRQPLLLRHTYAAGTTIRLRVPAGIDPVAVRTVPHLALRAAGLFQKQLAELEETRYQFTRPYVLDSSVSEEMLGLRPTPWDEICRANVARLAGRG